MSEQIFEKTCSKCGRQLKRRGTLCWTCRRDQRLAGEEGAFLQVIEKVCFRCKGDPQPIGNFGESKYNKDGHKGVCKTCRAKADDEWYAEHRDEDNARSRAYYKANKTRLDAENKQRDIDNREKYRPAKRANQKKRYDANPEPFRSEVNGRNAKVRLEALALLGNVCVCCGESDVRFLTFDHKHGDGADHRRMIGGSQKASSSVLFRWIKKNVEEARQILQILCWNCNNGSWKNGGTCPHQQEFNIVSMALMQQVALAA